MPERTLESAMSTAKILTSEAVLSAAMDNFWKYGRFTREYTNKMQPLLDSNRTAMTAEDRAFWELTAATCLAGHVSVPDSKPNAHVVAHAFDWADMALEVYRGRLVRE